MEYMSIAVGVVCFLLFVTVAYLLWQDETKTQKLSDEFRRHHPMKVKLALADFQEWKNIQNGEPFTLYGFHQYRCEHAEIPIPDGECDQYIQFTEAELVSYTISGALEREVETSHTGIAGEIKYRFLLDLSGLMARK